MSIKIGNSVNFKNILIIILGLSIMACKTDKTNISVNVQGKLMDIMHNGARDGIVNIGDLLGENMYGLGPLEGLNGEYIILNGTPILTRSDDGKSSHKVENYSSEKALLAVTSKVEEWKSIEVSNHSNIASLERAIRDVAQNSNIDIEKPFPFLIKGNLSKVNWHIIRPSKPGGSHDEHLAGAWKEEVENVDGEILGFYSNKHHRIFTHHDSNVHMHVVISETGMSGHIDALEIGESVELFLPVK